MRNFRSRHDAIAVLVVAMTSFSLTTATPALASSSKSAAVHAAAAEWTYYATYSSYDSCTAAANANSQGRKWQCVASTRSVGFDLYFSH